jgi:lysophosphatidic acid acyltransferase/lysophosphatidylinositol acyltransferase
MNVQSQDDQLPSIFFFFIDFCFSCSLRGKKKKKQAVIFLACICSIGAIMFIQRFSLLSNWKGISSLAFAVAFDAILIHTFIEYTKLPEQGKAQATNGQVVKLH